MSTLALFFLFANVLCDTVGQSAFKVASDRAGDADGLQRWVRLLRNPILWIGIAFFLVEALMWFAFLSMVPLSQGVMMGSLNIVTVMIAGWIFFKEQVTLDRTLAIVIITLGVALVGWGHQ